MALSSLPCLTPPFISASLATLSFPPLPLLSLHLASFPCLPPSPSHCTWLCWLPLHCSCHSLLLDPVLSSPNPQLPPSCPHARCAPPSSPSPAQNLSLQWRKERSSTKSAPGVLHLCPKSFFPFPHLSWRPHQAASRLTSFPGVSCVVTARHSFASSISLTEAMIWQCWWTIFTQWSGIPYGRSRHKEKCWMSSSCVSQTCARGQCSSHTLQEVWDVPGVFLARGHLGLREKGMFWSNHNYSHYSRGTTQAKWSNG